MSPSKTACSCRRMLVLQDNCLQEKAFLYCRKVHFFTGKCIVQEENPSWCGLVWDIKSHEGQLFLEEACNYELEMPKCMLVLWGIFAGSKNGLEVSQGNLPFDLSGIVSCDAAAIRIRIRIMRCQRPAKRQKHKHCETQP